MTDVETTPTLTDEQCCAVAAAGLIPAALSNIVPQALAMASAYGVVLCEARSDAQLALAMDQYFAMVDRLYAEAVDALLAPVR